MIQLFIETLDTLHHNINIIVKRNGINEQNVLPSSVIFCRLFQCGETRCSSHGVCSEVEGTHQIVCLCYGGYDEDDCSVDIDECESNPCQHGGCCFDEVNKYACFCTSEYIGHECETSKHYVIYELVN